MIDLDKPLTTIGGYSVWDVHKLSKPVGGKYVFLGLTENMSGFVTILWTIEGVPRNFNDVFTLINEPEEEEAAVTETPLHKFTKLNLGECEIIDITKPLTTEGGYPVRDVHQLSEPVAGIEFVGVVRSAAGNEEIIFWRVNGSPQNYTPSYTLINEPQETDVWVNLFYAPSNNITHSSHGTEHLARVAVAHNSHLNYSTIAFPVKIPIGYGMGENEDA